MALIGIGGSSMMVPEHHSASAATPNGHPIPSASTYLYPAASPSHSHHGGGSGQTMSSSSILYSKKVPVRIKAPDREDHCASLDVKVALQAESSQQMLYVELTNEADPYFLYTLQVSESDFHVLKTDQRLLVDFQTFPSKFIELLEECLKGQHSQPLTVPPSPSPPQAASSHTHPAHNVSTAISSYAPSYLAQKFVAILLCGPGSGPSQPAGGSPSGASSSCGAVRCGEATLNLVETNQFRELTHLFLRLRRGNDDAVKKYLAKKLTEFKVRCEDMGRELHTAGETQRKQSHDIDDLTTRLNSLQIEHGRMKESLSAHHQEEVARLKQMHMQEMQKIQQVGVEERQAAEGRTQQQIDGLAKRLEEAEKSNRNLQEKKVQLESSDRDLSRRLKNCESELQSANEQLQSCRVEVKDLEKVRHQNEKSLTGLNEKIKGYIEQLQSKDSLLSNSNTLIDQLRSQKASLEDHLSEAKAAHKELEDKFQESLREINKGNEIIENLQQQVKSMKAKSKAKSTTIAANQKTINELELKIEKQKQDIQLCEKRLVEAAAREASLKEDIEKEQHKLAEAQKALAEKQNFIDFVNQQWVERELTVAFPPKTQTPSQSAQRFPSAPALPHANSHPSQSPSSLLPPPPSLTVNAPSVMDLACQNRLNDKTAERLMQRALANPYRQADSRQLQQQQQERGVMMPRSDGRQPVAGAASGEGAAVGGGAGGVSSSVGADGFAYTFRASGVGSTPTPTSAYAAGPATSSQQPYYHTSSSGFRAVSPFGAGGGFSSASYGRAAPTMQTQPPADTLHQHGLPDPGAGRLHRPDIECTPHFSRRRNGGLDGGTDGESENPSPARQMQQPPQPCQPTVVPPRQRPPDEVASRLQGPVVYQPPDRGSM
ncbi:unnamed protein product [Vitrella brassicaformis CCMP3155]|uniref:Spindle assembly abnormal protein 6 N-terminal domain-containing protein n=3 Tax=Vitrella brassicaformis TaxID=1169539 RepID=A0A0G4ERZ9_VITBC|nr:unnamed protein product [Vitrella brassicaformis CCMP3155]|eukprot:CEM00829.1 unnamed protein product [Vitrella brassicaformis CCMP3155]